MLPFIINFYRNRNLFRIGKEFVTLNHIPCTVSFVGVALLNQTPLMMPAKNGVKSPYQLPSSVAQPTFGRHNQSFSNSKTLQDLAAEDEVPIVRLGDASIAAPFTAKMSSAIGG